ncbi:arylesterase [Caulobacter sp. RHG1]|uniref:arylesterase n=1 Tax=Caulobacter sp. (strain RHG1) TaxID=2545762 RepID=UPI00155517F1|nr:arylesterase [Caulobacter sp. RHG1]NQE63783.1 Arylesterase precursor [Caulobacter sp. RHG1]
MAKFPSTPFDRRNVLAGLLVLAAPGVVSAAQRRTPRPPPPPPPVVTVLGDSITAGLGLSSELSMPARLQAALDRMGTTSRVRGFGVLGDTTANGLARVDRVPAETTVCVVALGGNDLLLGTDPSRSKANLRAIISHLKARGIRVVLAGVKAPGLLGVDYARRFTQIYPDLAREQDVFYAPDFFTGVIGVSRYMQRDGIHPNAEGARIIAERLAPVVARALKA